MTLSKTSLSIVCRYAASVIVVMLNANMLNVITPSVVMLNVIMLSVVLSAFSAIV